MRLPVIVPMLSLLLILPLLANLLLASRAAAGDQTPHDEFIGRGYFGAPVVKYAVIRDQGEMMLGGRGGWNVTPSLSLGGGLYGGITGVDGPEGAVLYAPGRLDVRFESFGFELEYAARPEAPTHLTLAAFLGGAADRYVRDGTDEQFGETDFMLLFEPAVGVEQKVADSIHLNLAVSYRLVSGVEQAGLKNSDFNGVGVALAVKWGRF